MPLLTESDTMEYPALRGQIKDQVLKSKAESHRLWKAMNESPSEETRLAFQVEYSVYWRLWLLYKSLFIEEIGHKPKRIEHYVFMDS